ncbi:protein UPSTREAM OF FLC-like [Phalaenopsis equestris]|uniref:protein UPSTREAM OF FLC-like n=1 Tax=Phalaenopsis equestris TaxID=78828 RepID=UPI0009E2B279|nr:protein UPSTREAM OF FLC-like [Phalaenopsis equestris]
MDGLSEMPSISTIRLEDKEYFSGSLIETKKKTLAGDCAAPGLKRSSSYNAEGSSKMEVGGGLGGGGCIPAGKNRATARGSKKMEIETK